MSNRITGILFTIGAIILAIIGVKLLSKIMALGMFVIVLAAGAAVVAIIYYNKHKDTHSKNK
jgi:hypothetical protein